MRDSISLRSILILLTLACSEQALASEKASLGLGPTGKTTIPRLKSSLGGGPYTQVARHHIGNLQLWQTNLGQFGTGFVGPQPDPITGERAPSCAFPANSAKNYLFVGSFFIGAIVGRDTLVSTGYDGFSATEF